VDVFFEQDLEGVSTDYQIAISPELDISPEEFVSAWNDNQESLRAARAELADDPSKRFAIDPATLEGYAIFLAGVGSTILTDVLKDLIKNQITELIEKKLGKKQSAPAIEVLIIEQKAERPLIVVKEHER
jgi:hypothetical protein